MGGREGVPANPLYPLWIHHWITVTLYLLKCRLLMTFANSFDPDQAQQNLRPDLVPS